MLVSHSEGVKKEDDSWVSALSTWINGSSLTAAGNMRAGLVHGEMMSSVWLPVLEVDRQWIRTLVSNRLGSTTTFINLVVLLPWAKNLISLNLFIYL